jgi:hypothetical protein
MNRDLVTGAGLAAALMLGTLAFTGGAKAEAPKAAPAAAEQGLSTTISFLAEAPKAEAPKVEASKPEAPKAEAAKPAPKPKTSETH